MWAEQTYDIQIHQNDGVKRKDVVKMNTIKAKCAYCGYEEEYVLSADEYKMLRRYEHYGRKLGYIQDLFPRIPAWIRSGAIDKYADGFCICPKCCP